MSNNNRWHRWATALVLLLVAVGGWATQALAAERASLPPTRNLDPVGQFGGAANVIAARDNYAYVGQGSWMIVYDVSDPAHPRPVHRSAPFADQIEQIVLSGDYAYVVNRTDFDFSGGGVWIFQITDPTTPRLVGHYPVPNFRLTRLTLFGSYGYVTTGGPSFRNDLVDFSDPASPKLAAAGVLESGPMAVVGQYAYVWDWKSTELRAYDISDPAHPVLAGAVAQKIRVTWLMNQGGYLFEYLDNDILSILDVSNPAAPSVLGQIGDARSHFDGVVVQGNQAFLTSRFNSQVAVADLSDPAHPLLLASAKSGAGPPQMAAMQDGYAYVASNTGGLRIYDLHNPKRLPEIGTFDGPGSPTGTTGTAVADGIAYVADLDNGLHIVDVSDPTNPRPLGVYRDGSSAVRVTVRNGYAYLLTRSLAANQPNLRIVDVRDPVHPVLAGGLILGGLTQDLTLSGQYAYVVVSGTLRIVDVSTPGLPREVVGYNPPLDPSVDPVTVAGRTARVAADGNYVYMASETSIGHGKGTQPTSSPADSGLRVLDVSDPSQPAEIAFLPTGWAPDAVAVVGRQLYVNGHLTGPNAENGLRVFDISDPRHPVPGDFVPIGGAVFGGGIAVSGQHAFVATLGLSVLDIADPSHPIDVGYSRADAHSVAAQSDLAYIGSSSNGLLVLRFSDGSP